MEAELFLLCTASAHPCSWVFCSPAQKLAKAGSLELRGCPLVTSVFGIWAACKGTLWLVWNWIFLQHSWGCVVHWDAGVAWLRWGTSTCEFMWRMYSSPLAPVSPPVKYSTLSFILLHFNKKCLTQSSWDNAPPPRKPPSWGYSIYSLVGFVGVFRVFFSGRNMGVSLQNFGEVFCFSRFCLVWWL